MKRQIVVIAFAIASFFSSSTHAQQYYTAFAPTNTMHASGSSHAKNGLTWNTFSSSYLRSAHETFMKHGTKTQPLSALYFNSDDFRMSHLFENCQVPLGTKNYNAFMRVGRMKPRVEYTEQGSTVGFSVDRMVSSGRGRLGVRARTEFKKRQIERKDTDSFGLNEVAGNRTRFYNNTGAKKYSSAFGLYRLDFFEALPSKEPHISSIDYTAKQTTLNSNGIGVVGGNAYTAVIYAPEGQLPRGSNVGVTSVKYGDAGTEMAGYLPATGSGLAEGSAYEVGGTGYDYSALADDATGKTAAARAADQDVKASLWFTTTLRGDGTTENAGAFPLAGQELKTTGRANEQFIQEIHSWLHDRGYELATDKHVGLGDTAVELFYQHELSDTLSMELSGGIVAPTAAGKKQHGNPYNVHLGNNGHLEVIAGLGFEWQPVSWLNVSLHGDYGKALKEREQRMAVATGSLVKNIGPRADAEVEWQWVRANADFSFVHPKMRGLSTTVGYRFFYKEREKVTFDDATMDSWLGTTYDSAAYDYTGANTFTLDNTLASVNTEMLAHTIRMHCQYDVNEFFSLNCGGSYVVAGQNMPQETEMHVGCVVKL